MCKAVLWCHQSTKRATYINVDPIYKCEPTFSKCEVLLRQMAHTHTHTHTLGAVLACLSAHTQWEVGLLSCLPDSNRVAT